MEEEGREEGKRMRHGILLNSIEELFYLIREEEKSSIGMGHNSKSIPLYKPRFWNK